MQPLEKVSPRNITPPQEKPNMNAVNTLAHLYAICLKNHKNFGFSILPRI
jgi:S-ribosylhomocysteine lyase LuxS involved in autoinducer biosynthesis